VLRSPALGNRDAPFKHPIALAINAHPTTRSLQGLATTKDTRSRLSENRAMIVARSSEETPQTYRHPFPRHDTRYRNELSPLKLPNQSHGCVDILTSAFLGPTEDKTDPY
jgi:hypothetical protein